MPVRFRSTHGALLLHDCSLTMDKLDLFEATPPTSQLTSEDLMSSAAPAVRTWFLTFLNLRLRDDNRSSKDVLGYLEAENKYAESYFKVLEPLVNGLADDLDSRLPDVEVSQPNLQGSYIYYRKRGPGDEYWNMYRVPVQLVANEAQHGGQHANLAAAVQAAAAAVQAAAAADVKSNKQGSSNALHQAAGEQLVFDENGLSANHSYWDVYETEVSPDGTKIAFAYDTVGAENYSLQVSDLSESGWVSLAADSALLLCFFLAGGS